MNFSIKATLSFLLLFAPSIFADAPSCANLYAAKDNNFAKTHWTERPTGQQYFIYGGAGVQDKINLYGKGEFYGVFDVTILYEQTARSGKNSSYFAGQDGLLRINSGQGGTMPDANYPIGYSGIFAQSNAVGSYPFDIRASDIGLAQQTYQGTFCFAPRIQNFVANLDLWLGFDEFIQGLYARIRAPITWTRWDIRLTAQTENPGDTLYNIGFLSNNPITTLPADLTAPLTSGAVALSGQTVPTGMPVLEHGRICGRDDQPGVADLPIDLGYNFILTERARLGASLHVVAPTGTKNDGACVFAPRIGLGRWQVGAQVGGQYQFWNCDEQYMTIYAEVMVTALVGRTEKRLLGLVANGNTAFNHYLLLKKYNVGGTTVSLERAANLLYQPIKLGTSVNSDIALWWQYRNQGFDFSVAYQFTGRSKEKLSNMQRNAADSDTLIAVPNATFGDPGSTYVIKGDSPLYLYTVNGVPAFTGSVPDHHFYDKADTDIRVLGTISNTAAPANDPIANNAFNQALANAYAFTPEDVVADPALHPAAITNALAFYLGYNWCECDWQPFLGGGAMYEFGQANTSMSMWAAFIKGGVAF